MITIGLYVDDLLITSHPTFIAELRKSFKRIEVNRGTVHDPAENEARVYPAVSHREDLDEWLVHQHLVASHSITTVSNFPASPDLLKLSKDDDDLLDETAQKELHSSVAKIQYLARVRSDIQFVVSHLICTSTHAAIRRR
jgi:hypothetical protein